MTLASKPGSVQFHRQARLGIAHDASQRGAMIPAISAAKAPRLSCMPLFFTAFPIETQTSLLLSSVANCSRSEAYNGMAKRKHGDNRKAIGEANPHDASYKNRGSRSKSPQERKAHPTLAAIVRFLARQAAAEFCRDAAARSKADKAKDQS